LVIDRLELLLHICKSVLFDFFLERSVLLDCQQEQLQSVGNFLNVYLFSFNQGKLEPINYESLGHELLETSKCYFLDCGAEVYVWMGRTISLQERKNATEAAEVIFIFNKLRLSYYHSYELSCCSDEKEE
jgi:hypothetical protein